MPASRREFVLGMGVLGAATLFAFDRTEPDVILYNGNFWTVNPRQPRAQAVAISGGRFLAIGSNDEVLALAVGSATKVDLGGMTVLPGFIDAHSHPAEAGLSHLRMVDCDQRSIADILRLLHERALKTPAGDWVLGFKYDDTKTVEGRPLSIAELDAAVPDHPVYGAATRPGSIRKLSSWRRLMIRLLILRAENTTTIPRLATSRGTLVRTGGKHLTGSFRPISHAMTIAKVCV
jgi:hypothetical protein